MVRGFYPFLVIMCFIACGEKSNPYWNELDDYKQANYNKIVLDFLNSTGIDIGERDTVIIYEPSNCIMCTKHGIEEKFNDLNVSYNQLIVFSQSDSISISDALVSPLKISVKSDEIFKNNNIKHTVVYRYYLDKYTKKLVGHPL